MVFLFGQTVDLLLVYAVGDVEEHDGHGRIVGVDVNEGCVVHLVGVVGLPGRMPMQAASESGYNSISMGHLLMSAAAARRRAAGLLTAQEEA